MKEIRAGVLKVGLGRYSQVLTEIIITAVMARLLSPEEFGVVASIMVFYAFAIIPIQMGLEPTVIRDRGLGRDQLSGMYYMTALSSAGMAIIFYLGSIYLLPGFYGSGIYRELGVWMAPAIIFSGLNTIPRAMMLRDRRFGAIGVIQLIVSVITGLLGIYLAMRGYSYKAIVIRHLSMTVLQLLVTMKVSGLEISLRSNLSGYKKNNTYSRNQLWFSIINYFSRNLDNILIGRYLGMGSLGYYDKAYKLMLYPVKNLTSVIGPVLHPVLSAVKKEEIFSEYMKVVKILAVLGFTIGAFTYHSSAEIVELFYGQGWSETAGIFKVLSVIVGIQVIMSSSGAIFQATGRTDLLLKAGVFSMCTNVMAISGGIALGSPIYIGKFLIISFTINFLQCYHILMQIFHKTLRCFLLEIRSSLIYGAGTFVVLGTAPEIGSNLMINLIYKGSISLGIVALIYLCKSMGRR